MSATLAAVTAAAHAHHPGGWGGGPGFGWLFLLIPLFWIVVIGILFAVFGRRWRRAAANGYGPHGRMSPARQAEATLAQRYAQGDIDEVEYRARLEVIRTHATP